MYNIAYDKSKVEEFKLAFNEYKNAKQSFKSKMTQFQKTIEFMKGTLLPKALTTDNENDNYVMNRDGILMKRHGVDDNTYDSSENSVVSIGNKKAFVTDVTYQADASRIDGTNILYQVGLTDLTYDSMNENIISDDNKYVKVTDDPTIIDEANDCNLNHLSQCSAKAKMENKSYYGIRGGTYSTDKENCECYTFDTQPLDIVHDRIKTIEIKNFGDSDAAYLATLMDGNFYKIKQNGYSNNYSGFYDNSSSSDNLSEIMNGRLSHDDGLNPFVGNGINGITISELGVSTCSGV
jgi:hypothetical protein